MQLQALQSMHPENFISSSTDLQGLMSSNAEVRSKIDRVENSDKVCFDCCSQLMFITVQAAILDIVNDDFGLLFSSNQHCSFYPTKAYCGLLAATYWKNLHITASTV